MAIACLSLVLYPPPDANQVSDSFIRSASRHNINFLLVAFFGDFACYAVLLLVVEAKTQIREFKPVADLRGGADWATAHPIEVWEKNFQNYFNATNDQHLMSAVS